MNAYGYPPTSFPHAPAPGSPYSNLPFLGGDAFTGRIPHPSYPYSPMTPPVSSAPPGLAGRPTGMAPPTGMTQQQPGFGMPGQTPFTSSGRMGMPVSGNNPNTNPYTGPGITPPFNWIGHGISSPMYQQGWRVGNDGRWYPPGTSSGPAASGSPY